LEEIDGELVNDSLESQTLNTLVEHYVVGAMSTHQAMDYFKPGSVIITPSDREDIILAALGTAAADRSKQMKTLAAMILTGKTMPHPAILDLIHSSRIPVLICHQDTYTTASQVHDLLAKIRADDAEKIEHAARLVGDYFDFAAIYPEMA
jgi:BioD-like phosphotransacetylase family protein